MCGRDTAVVVLVTDDYVDFLDLSGERNANAKHTCLYSCSVLISCQTFFVLEHFQKDYLKPLHRHIAVIRCGYGDG